MEIQLRQAKRSDRESCETIHIQLSPEDHGATYQSHNGRDVPSSNYSEARRYSGAISIETFSRYMCLLCPLWTDRKIIHPAFRQSSRLDKDDGSSSPNQIASGTYSQTHKPMALSSRVIELTRLNSFLLQRLAYHKTAELAEMRYSKKAEKLCTDIESAFLGFMDSSENNPCDRKGQRKIYPLFYKHYSSGIAGNITALDHLIARNGGTTSTYEELPHRLQLAKKTKSETPAEKESELVWVNRYLSKELEYHSETRTLEKKFFHSLQGFQSQIESILEDLRQTLEARRKARINARSILLDFWGIESVGDNITESIF